MAHPAWVTVCVEWLPVGAVVLAVVLPVIRVCLRKFRGHQRAYQNTLFVHDMAAGVTLPTFFALAISPMAPDIVDTLERLVLCVAGLLGIIHTLRSVFERHDRAHDSLL